MHRTGKLLVVLLLAATTTFAATPATKKAGTVATIGTSAITEEELNAAVGHRMMRIQTEAYNMKRAALEDVIAQRLLDAEAARRHVTTEELIAAEIESKVATPEASDLESFYEGTKDRFGGLSKEEAIQQIADGIRKQKSAQRRAEFVATLRKAAGVKVLLEAPRVEVEAKGRARGNDAAPITIVEFSDFECSFCSRATSTLKKVESTYGDKVRIVFRDYPLPIHRGAPRAAEAAQCAGDQGKFWEMHDRLFSKGGAIAEGDIRKYASELELDTAAFAQCLDSGRHAQTWKASQEAGMKLGVSSTPTFFVNGRMISGAMPYETFAKVIEEELGR